MFPCCWPAEKLDNFRERLAYRMDGKDNQHGIPLFFVGTSKVLLKARCVRLLDLMVQQRRSHLARYLAVRCDGLVADLRIREQSRFDNPILYCRPELLTRNAVTHDCFDDDKHAVRYVPGENGKKNDPYTHTSLACRARRSPSCSPTSNTRKPSKSPRTRTARCPNCWG